MLKQMETQNVDDLLYEADELLRQIHSDVFNDMEDAHRLEFEKHAQSLEKIKAKAQEMKEKEGPSEPDSGADGIHEAILDIVKALHVFTMKGKGKEPIGKQAVSH